MDSPQLGDLIYIWDRSENRSKAWTMEQFLEYLNSTIVLDGGVELPDGTYGGIDGYEVTVPVITVDLNGDIIDISEESLVVPSVIDELLDVDTSGVSTGDVLAFDGTNWVPYTLPALPPMPDVEYGIWYVAQEYNTTVVPTVPATPGMIASDFYLILSGDPGDKFEIDMMFYCEYPLDAIADICYFDFRYNYDTSILTPDVTDVVYSPSQYVTTALNNAVGGSNARLQMNSKCIFELGAGETDVIIKPKLTQGAGSPFTVKNRILTARRIVRL
jgi:hypothetical protein